MIGEQLSRGGVSTVGFGDADMSIKNPVILDPIIGLVVGTIGGSLLGNAVKKGVGAVLGSIAGGLGGVVVGEAIAIHNVHVATDARNAARAWRLLQPNAAFKAGQQFAFAATRTDHTLSTADIADGNQAMNKLATELPEANIMAYPPGMPLPSDWPSDDDFGPQAYRFTGDVVKDGALDLLSTKLPSTFVFKAWARDKP